MSTKSIYNFIIVLSIIGLILPIFVSAKASTELSRMSSPQASFAQVENKYPEAPGTFEEAKNFLFSIIKPLPDAMKGAWQEALAIWQRMADFFKGLWNLRIKPWFQNIWQEILVLFGREFEKKELMIQEELEKEKEEIKKEIPKVGKSIWERVKDWINR